MSLIFHPIVLACRSQNGSAISRQSRSRAWPAHWSQLLAVVLTTWASGAGHAQASAPAAAPSTTFPSAAPSNPAISQAQPLTQNAADLQASAGLPAPTFSAGALTLQQIIQLAQSRNPSILAARQSLEAVPAQEIQAGVRANPYFTLYGTNVTLPAAGASNPYAYSA